MRVMLNAYIQGNLGDDLMIMELCERYPQTHFYLTGKSCYESTFSKIANIHYIKNDTRIHRLIGGALRRLLGNQLAGYREFKLLTGRYDYFIYIGGSMFIEADYLGKEQHDGLWLKKTPYIVGCNFGPYKNEAFYRYYLEAFSHLPGITTREERTKKLFEKNCRIEAAPDVVFGRKPKYCVSAGDEVIISVVAPGAKIIGEEQYGHLLCSIVNIVSQKQLKPVLVSFCKQEGDEEIISRIIDQVNVPCEHLYYSGKNLDEIEKRIAAANCVIAGRFHSMILAFIYQKKCLPIVYSPKMTHVLNDINFYGYTYELAESADFSFESLDAFLDNEDYFIIDPEYLKRAKKQFVFVDEALS